jgi:hypothetical protein
MIKSSARYPKSFTLNEDEETICQAIREKGYSVKEIFCEGMKFIQEDLVKELTQNNVS